MAARLAEQKEEGTKVAIGAALATQSSSRGRVVHSLPFKAPYLNHRNCIAFNPPGNPVRDLGIQLKREFEERACRFRALLSLANINIYIPKADNPEFPRNYDLTILQADENFDAGPVWVFQQFPIDDIDEPSLTKHHIHGEYMR